MGQQKVRWISELHRLMEGEVKIQHEPKVCIARHARMSKEAETKAESRFVFLQLCGLNPSELTVAREHNGMWVPAKRKSKEDGESRSDRGAVCCSFTGNPAPSGRTAGGC